MRKVKFTSCVLNIVSCSMNLDANCGPLSLKIFLGTPCNFQISSLHIVAMPSAEMFIVVVFS